MLAGRILFSIFSLQVTSEVVSGHLSCGDFKEMHRKDKKSRMSDASTTRAGNRSRATRHRISATEAVERKVFELPRNVADLDSFDDYGVCLGRSSKAVKSHLKYRAIDGYGNNLKILIGELRKVLSRGSVRKLRDWRGAALSKKDCSECSS